MKLYLHLILLFVLLGCQSQVRKVEKDFILDLPDNSTANHTILSYDVKKVVERELNLSSLESGVDSFELRLWSKVEVTNGGQVIIIKNQGGEWSCLDYFYLDSHKKYQGGGNAYDFLTSISIDSFKVSKKHPRTDWVSFLRAIEREGIYELKTQEEIENWKSRNSDGKTYMVEYATKNIYRFYKYNSPELYAEDFPECYSMVKIIEIFNKEIGLHTMTNPLIISR